MRYAVSGGTTGIGAETVTLLKNAGHAVVVYDLSAPERDDVDYIGFNLNDADSIDAAIAATTGRFDGLCHIAGIPPREGNTIPSLMINAVGAFRFIEGIMGFLDQGTPIVSVASRAGMDWQDNIDILNELISCSPDKIGDWATSHNINATLSYKLAKQALIYWHQQKVAEKIGQHRFITVSPAAVSSGILDDFIKAFGPQVEKNLALVGRAGTPLEAAEVIRFAVSPSSSWLNGIDIIVDGGMGALNLKV